MWSTEPVFAVRASRLRGRRRDKLLALPSQKKKPAKDAGFVVAPSGLEPELS